ncbi:MAG: signal peptidase II [Herbinix sp.]|nr:signal peptidase II [Herbinix sp.]
MKERIKHFILFIILIGIDQASKFWVKAVLMNNDPIVIIPGVLELQYLENQGAVWGILSGKVDFLKVFSFFVFLLILFLYLKIPQGKKYNVLKIIAVFILAGAVGNLIDRLYLNYVVDFIYFKLINFPIFNIADSYLTVCSILLFLLAIFYYKDDDFAFLEQIFNKKNQATSAGQESKPEDNTTKPADDHKSNS